MDRIDTFIVDGPMFRRSGVAGWAAAFDFGSQQAPRREDERSPNHARPEA
ncbi:hypothetical protein [Novosphingobium aromaticivorans]|nr:hypothetical protein [Novosphingobium aromaticivorans]